MEFVRKGAKLFNLSRNFQCSTLTCIIIIKLSLNESIHLLTFIEVL